MRYRVGGTRWALIAVLCAWGLKLIEICARQLRIVPGNLGWGFMVDLTLPVAVTLVAGMLVAVLRIHRGRSS